MNKIKQMAQPAKTKMVPQMVNKIPRMVPKAVKPKQLRRSMPLQNVPAKKIKPLRQITARKRYA